MRETTSFVRPPIASSAPPTNVRWQIFGLSCAASWTLYLHRYTFGLVMPILEEEWGVSLVDLGLMQSAFYIPYVVMQVPSGLLVDWLGARVFLGGIITAWSGTLALHAWAPGPQQMYWVRILFGITQAGCYPALGKVTQAWFPFSIRTSLQGWIASFFGRLGGFTANLMFASVMLGVFALSWRTSLLILSAWGVLLGIAVLVVFRNTPAEHPHVNDAERALIAGTPPEQAQSAPAAGKASVAEDAAQVARLANDRATVAWWRQVNGRSAVNLAFFLVQFFGATFADTVYVAWMPFVLKNVHKVSKEQMGIYASLPLLGGALGGLCGGYLNDALIRAIGRRWARSAVGFTSNAVAGILVLVALQFFEFPLAFCCVLFCAKLFSDWSQPTTWGTVTDISGPYAATVFGLGNGIGGVGAILAPPLLAGVAADYDWETVFLLVAATYLASSVVWLGVNCTIPLFNRQPKAA